MLNGTKGLGREFRGSEIEDMEEVYCQGLGLLLDLEWILGEC